MSRVISVRRRLAIGAATALLLTGLGAVTAAPAHAAPTLALFVDVSNGDDSNSCTAAGVGNACKTIQAALNKAADGIKQDVTITVADGTYNPDEGSVPGPVTIPGTGANPGDEVENSISINGTTTAGTKLLTSSALVLGGAVLAVLVTKDVPVTLDTLTVANGTALATAPAIVLGIADIATGASPLTITLVTVDGLHSPDSSGAGTQVIGVFAAGGPLVMTESAVQNLMGGNGTSGGAVVGIEAAALTLTDSTISDLTSGGKTGSGAPATLGGAVAVGIEAINATVRASRISAVHAAGGLAGPAPLKRDRTPSASWRPAARWTWNPR
jgi:hypothetical protein